MAPPRRKRLIDSCGKRTDPEAVPPWGRHSGHIAEELRASAPAAGVSDLVHTHNTVEDLCEAIAHLANAQRGKGNSS